MGVGSGSVPKSSFSWGGDADEPVLIDGETECAVLLLGRYAWLRPVA